eukprot:366313-Chlamydomonas_euryale.AAC.14
MATELATRPRCCESATPRRPHCLTDTKRPHRFKTGQRGCAAGRMRPARRLPLRGRVPVQQSRFDKAGRAVDCERQPPVRTPRSNLSTEGRKRELVEGFRV